MFDFIESFLRNRSFHVRASFSLSNVRYLENGIPQVVFLVPYYLI